MVTVSGWGRTDPDDNTSVPDQLQTAELPISSCANWMGQYSHKLPYFVCAGDAETGTCKGDSGGPLAFKSDDGIYTAIGIVSHRPGQCSGSSGAFVRISMYLDWIHEVSGIAMTNSDGDLSPTASCTENDHNNFGWITTTTAGA